MQIGIGYDVHKLVAGRKLVIGGVVIPFAKGLLGHSDADVLVHAVCDALLGAAGLGDIGTLFPDADPQYKDADSKGLLLTVKEKLEEMKQAAPEFFEATILTRSGRSTARRHSLRINSARSTQSSTWKTS